MSAPDSPSTQRPPSVTALSASEPLQVPTQPADGAADAQERGECPICRMMREGGCEPQFQAFMACGTALEKGDGETELCLKLFDAMKTCMEQNPAVFGPFLQTVQPQQQMSQEQDVQEAAAAQLS